ncbi:MAG: PAS domain S-box protein [Bacteroidia bacterium]
MSKFIDAHLASVLAKSRNPYLLLDTSGKPLWQNISFESWSPNILPESLYHILVSASRRREEIQLSDDTEQSELSKFSIEDQEGQTLWFEIDVQLYRGPEQSKEDAFSYLIQLNDISQQIHQQDRLRLLEAVFEVAEDAILITAAEPIDRQDGGPRVIEVNPAFSRLTGYQREEIIGKTPRILQGPDTDPVELAKITASLQKWQPLEVELINYRKDGTPFHVSMIIFPIANEAGLFTHWVSIQRDVTARKNAENQVRKTASLLKESQRISNTGSWELDVKTGQTIWTEEVYRIHEVPLDFDHNKANGIEFYHVDDQAIIINALTQAIEGQEKFDVRCRLITAKERTLWVRAIGEPIVENDEVTKVVGLFQDISQQYEAEEQVKKISDRLQLAIDSAGIGVWEFIPKTRQMLWDDTISGFFGLDPKTTVPTYDLWLKVLHPDDVEQIENALKSVFNGKNTLKEKYRVIRPDGEIRTIISESIVVRNEKGWVERITGVNYDITEREARLQELNLLNAVVDSAVDAVIITEPDAKQKILYVNPAHKKMTGYSFDELQGRSPRLFQGAETDKAILDEVKLAIQNHEPIQVELQNYRKSGEAFWVNLIITYVRNKANEVTHFVSIQRDITESKLTEFALIKAKETAEQASQAKTEFLSTMSHEIRTPLNAVIGVTGLLYETKLDEEQTALLQIIRQGGETLLSTINEVLDFAKIEAGKIELEKEHFALVDPIKDTIDLLANQATLKGVALNYVIEAMPFEQVVGDITRLRQILVNLVGNAIKFTHKGQIDLKVRALDSQKGKVKLEFAVKDTGIGIPKAKMDRLFQSFSQVDASTTRQYGGSGLGLAISRRLVDLLGGKIWVESEEGLGSTFFFTIVMEESHRKFEAEKDKTAQKTLYQDFADFSVLLVEDNMINQKVAGKMLHKFGVKLEIANNGLEAIDFVKMRQFDLVLMDMQMPIMDGLEASRQIRTLGTQINQPIIVAMTANTSVEDRIACANAGMDDFLSKPISLKAIHDYLVKWLLD